MKCPNFGFLVPESCADLPANVLDPRGTWSDKRAYDEIARNLRGNFEFTYARFQHTNCGFDDLACQQGRLSHLRQFCWVFASAQAGNQSGNLLELRRPPGRRF